MITSAFIGTDLVKLPRIGLMTRLVLGGAVSGSWNHEPERIQSADILVLKKLAEAIEVHMAVAFFNPSDRLMSALLALPHLSLIISEEFTVNDPYKIEQLTTAKLRSIPTDHDHGKLHAKVIIARLKDG